jgi:hypothetical protein
LVKIYNVGLLADSNSILNTRKKYFCQLLNVNRCGSVKQTEMHASGPLIPEPITFKVEIAADNFKKYKSPAIDQIPAELIPTGGYTLHTGIHRLTDSI